MRISTALFSSPTLAHPWLANLKTAELARVARATGIRTAGPKQMLRDRIDYELQLQQQKKQPDPKNYRQGHHQRAGDVHSDAVPPADSKTHEPSPAAAWSILSIDMGIQNLAFAHLRVTRPCSSSGAAAALRPELTAWRRLAVSEIAELNLDGNLHSNTQQPNKTKPKNTEHDKDVDDIDIVQPIPPKEQTEKDATFSLDLYAETAYSLIKSLISTYRPTHILIERQRFRSGGSSAVLEWTLRVGVFEGMLHAVLRTLRHECGQELDGLVVGSVEPRRVVGYWIDTKGINKDLMGHDHGKDEIDEGEREGVVGENGSVKKKKKDKGKEKEKKGKRMSPAEVKKSKIDIVGNWLLASVKDAHIPILTPSAGTATGVRRESDAPHEEKEQDERGNKEVKIILTDTNPPLHALTRAYLDRWKGHRGSKVKGKGKGKATSPLSSSSSSPSSSLSLSLEEAAVLEAEKLDDLADCLLQGVTWIEWQQNQRLFVLKGLSALESMRR